MIDFPADQLRAFAAVVDTGTFEAAARRLHVTPSAVSQRIKALERTAGTVVVRRTNPAQATPAGRVLVRLARQLDLLASEAAAELSAAAGGTDAPTARAPIALVVNADSLATWFGAALPVLAADPNLELEILREDEAFSAEHLRSGRVMGAVTTSGRPVQGCAADLLGSMRYLAVAAPAFADRWFGPDGPGLAGAPAVHFDRNDAHQRDLIRGHAGAAARPPGHHVPDSVQFVEAIRAGLGWGMVPEQQIPGDGSLRLLDPSWVHEVPLYWQRWKLDSPALARVTAAVKGAAAAGLPR
ncbi:LysR family transcriptional regulator ArgP [Zafaria sp. Z1313]|uniref:LysR family transcriptional regulator ArgP n=1 Tax=unclassified Zafaria TaxID=2828765 RepID=UPI002E7621DE|nr:LysR family transcriptional regulator ArgP [Zafaria sp. J156]MEE1621480.1 LysR family transcriptional regulator ArgP [Zafaria sp. J156]